MVKDRQGNVATADQHPQSSSPPVSARRLLARFRRLTLWNKLGLIGAIASIIGIPLAVLLWHAGSAATPVNINTSPKVVQNVVVNTGREKTESSDSPDLRYWAWKLRPSDPRVAAGFTHWVFVLNEGNATAEDVIVSIPYVPAVIKDRKFIPSEPIVRAGVAGNRECSILQKNKGNIVVKIPILLPRFFCDIEFGNCTPIHIVQGDPPECSVQVSHKYGEGKPKEQPYPDVNEGEVKFVDKDKIP